MVSTVTGNAEPAPEDVPPASGVEELPHAASDAVRRTVRSPMAARFMFTRSF